MVLVNQSRDALARVGQSQDTILRLDQTRCLSYECDKLTPMTEVPALDEIRERAHRLCGEYLRGAWRVVPAHQLIVRKISGGLSNLLYYCCLPPTCPPTQGEPSCVVLRLYGQTQGEQALQGLIAESVIFTLLSVSQRGPRLYGVVPGGRLEEYIPARPLVTEELADPRLSVLIAQKMAQIHMMDVPINKEPRWLWETINRWMSGIEEFMRETPSRGEFKAMNEQVAAYNLQREHNWLKVFLTAIGSRVVFCHNDVQEGNILLRNADNNNATTTGEEEDNDEARLVLIDFEYCSYNYRAFDIANHMCEWVYDYSNEQHPYFYAKQDNYPTPQQQERFVRHYLTTVAQETSTAPPTEAEVAQLVYQVKAFTLASHFFWGLWSVINASTSTIHFDYWGYGKERFTRYFQCKAELIHTEEAAEQL